MSDEPHYTFPPAAAYRLNRCLHAIKSDSAYCARFLADPAGAMDELGLGAEERAALVPIDRDALVGRGAHPYLCSWPSSGCAWRVSPARSSTSDATEETGA